MTDFRPITLSPAKAPALRLASWLALACVLAAVACGGDDAYHLRWGDRDVLPYEGSERLVFASDDGRRDTIYLAGYEERVVTPQIAGTVAVRQFEEYRLRSKRFDERVGQTVLQDDAVKVYRQTAGQTLIRFAMNTRGAALFRRMPTDTFAALPDTVFTAGPVTYRDVKVVNKDSLMEGKDAFVADRFYWSQEAGFVGYDRDTVRWRLVEVE